LNPFRYSVSKEIQSFAIENYNEMFGYINIGRINIRIHRDIEGPPNRSSDKPAKQSVARPDESVRTGVNKMWFGVG
jgi:hypothetical protein